MSLLSVVQMNSQDDIEANFTVIESLIQQSKAQDAELIVFPENFVCFAAGKQRETAAQFEAIQQRLEQLAHRYQIWIVAGTLPCPFRPDGSIIQDGRVRTVSLCISPERTEARYDKIHLFDVQVGDAVGGYQESRFFEPGDEVVVAKTPFGKLGLMVCYDLRFPELSLMLRTKGANILTAPAAFTYTTGKLHWQLLLQARAMDSQCFVLGAAQQGWHGEQRQTWGHAGITDSRGQLLQMIDTEGHGLITSAFDLDEQNTIRLSMPLIQHRRLINY
ncbi:MULTISPECIES: carbon-nitrogen hydrolase family protein [unclassified Acinetobacter]|uniref:carbon-nitrogen hydrolase family protein n=1 Tax=unclassified Acinetobacter TaxID=196816 RepID=UPI00244B4FB1|nr:MULTISPECIES: carbon-nitrogen hydrolase family protein [unclassified Acinetobacter]MDH0031449.1 carbon-nitrogen hydrolase family protein [Acinetobacter sp. GD04021]MDH0886792.1 carbon-nitrogen hydrolase family protein [Acinetobacter sp. GD03873]MDH1083395.1 carbon-nitrogen hydrolase family protein [Acinetobacter sp. GD03983]MDH2190108.1 carbon-nitrogen hydrolase family protein [Acinetobacter sp. GD03645]MDH2203413.1 carbon-nitrogen hydrolase family protein [Acinetobacter sp. GD03647]